MVDSESKQVVVPVTSSADSSSSWATDRAVARLNLGVTIQEAEKRLVAHGLSHATAASAVEAAVEERVRQKFLPLWRAGRRFICAAFSYCPFFASGFPSRLDAVPPLCTGGTLTCRRQPVSCVLAVG